METSRRTKVLSTRIGEISEASRRCRYPRAWSKSGTRQDPSREPNSRTGGARRIGRLSRDDCGEIRDGVRPNRTTTQPYERNMAMGAKQSRNSAVAADGSGASVDAYGAG
jgi:hypothetical protein